MGFDSAGLGYGSSFFFELPLYSPSVPAPGIPSLTDERNHSLATYIPRTLQSATHTKYIPPTDEDTPIEDDEYIFRTDEVAFDDKVFQYSSKAVSSRSSFTLKDLDHTHPQQVSKHKGEFVYSLVNFHYITIHTPSSSLSSR